MTRSPVRRVLVIKLGGLGDFALTFGAFAAIRRHHADARIILLTSPPYGELARKSGWFDEVREDGTPDWRHPGKTVKMIMALRRAELDRIYDLDNSSLTRKYRAWITKLFGSRAAWSVRPLPEEAPGVREHYVEQLVDQLEDTAVTELPAPDLGWLTAGFGGRYGLQDGYVLIAPGGRLARDGKGWPIARFCELARRLAIEGRRPVIIGDEADQAANKAIAASSPEAMDLTGRTSLFDIGALAAHASAALGNDSGILRLLAAVGCPTTVMFSGASHPALNSPRGRLVVILRQENLEDLQVSEVAAALRLR